MEVAVEVGGSTRERERMMKNNLKGENIVKMN